MKNKPKSTGGTRRTYILVTLSFLLLAIALQTILWVYWQKKLEPRLMEEGESQANVLAHSQGGKLAQALLDAQATASDHDLQECIDEILLLRDPTTGETLFTGLKLEVDTDVLDMPTETIALAHGTLSCDNCFATSVALYSPMTDELLGIASFAVNKSFFLRLRRDVKTTLFIQSSLGTLLLVVVYGVVVLLVRTVNHSRKQAEMASRAKSAFLANMSHELRTPLNSIIGFSELMSRDQSFPPEYRDNLTIITRSGEHLLELINDVLELSRIEAGHPSLMEAAFDLHETIDNVVEMIQPRVAKKRLQFSYEKAHGVPRYIISDERKLRQILLNLLGNGVKFTDEGGISLRVKRSETMHLDDPNSLELIFEVEDSGPGIGPAERATLFDAFTQTRNGYSKTEGTGLGLTISRQFVRQLGGAISVTSTPGEGSIFRFSIRTRQTSATVESQTQNHVTLFGLHRPDDGEIGDYRILVVDDHRDNRHLLKTLLERFGCTVKTANNGREAIAIHRSWHPQLIWMDIRMPEMDGYEATRKIREHGRASGVKEPIIIALTASAFAEDKEAVIAAGCNDFVRRPFRETDIIGKLSEHLGLLPILEKTPGLSDNRLSPPDLSPRMAQLPAKLRQNLREAIELSDLEQMNRLVARIADHDQRLANAVHELVYSFQYDMILQLLPQTPAPEPESKLPTSANTTGGPTDDHRN